MISFKRVNRYCCEDISNIENYDKAKNDTTKTWDCHHKLEIELNLTIQELINRNLYYNRPASELIFLTHSEHHRLHLLHNNPNKGKSPSEETKQKSRKTWKKKYENGYINPRTGHSFKENWTEEEIDNYSIKVSNIMIQVHKDHPEIAKKISKSLTGIKRTNEQRQHYKEAQNRPEVKQHKKEMLSGEGNPMYGKTGKDHPCFGRSWVNNNIEEVLIKKEDLDLFLNKGYKKGRLKK